MNKSRNRFNLISSKEWLPFQKSWFIHSDDTAMFRSNVRFFTKSDEGINNVFVDGLTKILPGPTFLRHLPFIMGQSVDNLNNLRLSCTREVI